MMWSQHPLIKTYMLGITFQVWTRVKKGWVGCLSVRAPSPLFNLFLYSRLMHKSYHLISKLCKLISSGATSGFCWRRLTTEPAIVGHVAVYLAYVRWPHTYFMHLTSYCNMNIGVHAKICIIFIIRVTPRLNVYSALSLKLTAGDSQKSSC